MHRVRCWAGVVSVVVGVWQPVGAQTIYRCGNEYTNNERMAKEKGCQVLEGAAVTVIPSGNSAGSANPSASERVVRPAAPRAAADPGGMRRPDNDAKAILQSELAKATARLESLKEAFQDGTPQRSALELRNPQGYLERVEAMRGDIARQERDVSSIQRELSRLP